MLGREGVRLSSATGAMDGDWSKIGSNECAWAAFSSFHPVSPISHLPGAVRATNDGRRERAMCREEDAEEVFARW